MRCSFKRTSRDMRRAAQSNVANPRQEGPATCNFPLTFEGHGVAEIVKSTVVVKQAFRNGSHKS